MNQLLFYGLQVLVISGILYGYYHFFLRNKRFHQYNRFYLLAAVLLSLVIPLLNIPVYFSEADTDSSPVLEALTTITYSGNTNAVIISAVPVQGSTWFTTGTILSLLYSALVVLALLRIILSLIRLRRITRHHKTERIDRIRFINTDEPGTPFSFFRWLFWNREIDLHSSKGEQVFRHELFHIEQRHSLDILFMELVTAIGWFNPFFHLIKKETKAIHEFLADRFAITENTRWQYAELLLMRALYTQQPLVNPFFHNQIKRRIAMITTSQKPRHQYLRKLMVLPLMAIVVAIFAFSYKARTYGIENAVAGNSQDTIPGKFSKKAFYFDGNNRIMIEADSILIKGDAKMVKPNIKDGLVIINGKVTGYSTFLANTYFARQIIFYKENDPEAVRRYGEKARKGVIVLTEAKVINVPVREYYKDELNKTANIADPDNKVFVKVEIEPAFPGGYEKWKEYLMSNLDTGIPKKKNAPRGDYTVIVQFIVDQEGAISDVRTLTKHGYGMEEEAMRVIKNGPKWKPAIQNGKIVKAYRKQPITFSIGTGRQFDHRAEIPASFPGGQEGWKNFLIKNVRSRVPVDRGAPAGTYKTLLQFTVHPDGSLSDFEPVTKHGFGMEQEVTRMLKDGPKWIPAVADGKKVKSYVQQPVTFVVAEDPDETAPSPATKPRIPAISVAEIKMASPFELLGLSKETEIVQFVFATDLTNGDISESYNNGSQFNEATKKLIEGMRAGRLVTIDQIVIMENGKEKKMASRVFEITN